LAIVTWSPSSNDYDTGTNWSTTAVPTGKDAAFFGASTFDNPSINTTFDQVGEWIFNQGASYIFSIGTGIDFFGLGIVNGGGVTINISNTGNFTFYNASSSDKAIINNDHFLEYRDLSTAGNAIITNNSPGLYFLDYSSAGNAVIKNNGTMYFLDSSSASSATIHTTTGAVTNFDFHSNAGSAQLITDASGVVDFSDSKGSAANHKLTVGSIAGAGTYDLGGDQLTVLSGDVSGPVDDGGGANGSGASLVKVGHGKLTLSHIGNTYSGGTTIEQGIFEVDAIGAAGPGAITFASVGKSKATIEIDNAALSGHVFATNKIDNFGKHDFLDLTGLHFHPGATAKYHPTTDVLAVHSGHGTDKFTLVSPHGTHFEVASDHHGGTDVFLVFA
jgi:autotransporter-associated beta strand protein